MYLPPYHEGRVLGEQVLTMHLPRDVKLNDRINK